MNQEYDTDMSKDLSRVELYHKKTQTVTNLLYKTNSNCLGVTNQRIIL